MSKSELISAMAEEANLSKAEAKKALDAFTSIVGKELKKGNKIQLVGFGTFEAPIKEAHKARNPQTGKETMVEAKKVPKFKAGKALKDSVQ